MECRCLFVGVGLNLLILPFVVFRLGLAAFGVAGLVTACIAPALAFSNSLALSTARELAQRLAPDERDDARRFFATALLLAAVMGGLIVDDPLFGWPAARPPCVPSERQGRRRPRACFCFRCWRMVVPVHCGGVSGPVYRAPGLSADRVDQHHQRNYCDGSDGGADTALAAGLNVSWLSGVGLCDEPACSVCAFALGYRWMAGASRVSSGPLGDLVSLGAWQLAAQGGGLIAGQADRYLLGALLAPQFVGFYTIAQRLEEAIYIGILKVGEILFPFFSALQKESGDRKADLLFRSSWVLNVLAASALGALIPVAGPLLHLWTGAEVAAEAQQVLVVLSVAGMLGCSANVFAFYLLANGRSRSNALISLVTAVFTLVTSAVALPYFGWQAAGWSSCVGMMAQIVTTISCCGKVSASQACGRGWLILYCCRWERAS